MDKRDEFSANLSGLRTLDADPLIVEKLRARCLHVLETRRSRKQSVRCHLALWRSRLELAAAFGISAVYLLAAVAGSLALYLP